MPCCTGDDDDSDDDTPLRSSKRGAKKKRGKKRAPAKKKPKAKAGKAKGKSKKTKPRKPAAKKKPKATGKATELCKLWARNAIGRDAPKCRFGRECCYRHAWKGGEKKLGRPAPVTTRTPSRAPTRSHGAPLLLSRATPSHQGAASVCIPRQN